ncbi:hypothetical protein EJ03DRAFT_344064 [Teratosphaeria nubilosa]|uniref:FAD-binding domain-containing protein n=1 Tax=Teratosphaeria nubilosa TaxID=161662 RepID=A0A6G1L7Q3_9PEZI|nr:hypothetical protein EJ03DRAFT_344064 [Teratosphaeria nubilosa]
MLIVGAGPAGASLACFLAAYGIKGMMVSRAAGTADTPRAHITNMAALECLRDIGLEVKCMEASTHGDCMVHTRWCESMAGREYARIHSWGNDPARKGDYELASPCAPVDLPQTLLEPILVEHAQHNGFECHWKTSFVSFEDRGKEGVLTTLRDDESGNTFAVHSKCLFGADGARSRIVKQLDLPLTSKPSNGVAINVLVEADLSHLIPYRNGNLHWIMQPEKDFCDYAWMCIARMVKPWHEWMFILFPKPGCESLEASEKQYLAQVKAFIGDNSVNVEIKSVSKWFINETIADVYSSGNVHCLGDAVHRHPPFNGLGSNTCVQDAFNLAWKIAYVERGIARPTFLSSFSDERQPVGKAVITRANDGFREHARVWKALGMLEDNLEQRGRIISELTSAGPDGGRARDDFQAAILSTCHEFHGLGVEMNQHYESNGIYACDEREPFRYDGPSASDPILYHMRSTYPGRRLPHAWLNKAIPQTPVSTIDLAGHGRFSLFTGVGGDIWKEAADTISSELDVPIKSYSIGLQQDFEDIYYDWARVRGVEESGAVLARPDRFVAWRCANAQTADDCRDRLRLVMQSLLGFS